jgi:hypothetical protein
MSRIIEYINPYFPKKKWYKCTIGNITHSGPNKQSVEEWRDDRMVNSDYYNELELLNQQSLAYQYNNNHNNWTGD